MKKILSLALALMMIMSMLVVFPVSAEDETTGYEIPRVAAGTITVDGDMDEAYENGLVFELKYKKDGTANADDHTISGKVYMVYDASNIYLYADVNDADELMTGPLTDEAGAVTDSSWSSDCVELTLGYLVEDNTSVKITPWGKVYQWSRGLERVLGRCRRSKS